MCGPETKVPLSPSSPSTSASTAPFQLHQSTYKNINPNIVKRMEREKCYNCGQLGHWSRYCPPNHPKNHNNHSTVSPKLIHCRCGHGFCDVKIAHSEKNWGKEYFVCPIKRGARCNYFVKWYNDPINESDLQPPLFKYPLCECGAGVCRRLEETTERPYGVKYYFMCPIKQGQGSCGYCVSEDELLNNTSIVPIQRSRQRSIREFFEGCQNDTTNNDLGNDLGEGSDLQLETKGLRIMDSSENTSSVAVSKIHEGKDAGFLGSEVADGDLEVTNSVSWKAIDAEAFLSSRLLTPSKIHRRQSLLHRDIFAAAAASFGSFPADWFGRLIFSHPTQSLKMPPPQPFFCCIFPSLDPIVVPKQTCISNGHSECNNPAATNILSTACHIEISKGLVVSPSESPGSERKPVPKVQRHREVALFTQQRLLSDLESLDLHQHEAMREAAETTFALLNILEFECEQFSDHIWDFINLASSMAEIDKSRGNFPSFEEHNKILEEEKVRLAHIQNDCSKTEALLEVSNQQRKLLCEQVSHLEAKLYEKQNELKSCEPETMKIDTQLSYLKRSMLEVDITLKDRVRRAEVARERSVERYEKQIAAKNALEKAKLVMEN